MRSVPHFLQSLSLRAAPWALVVAAGFVWLWPERVAETKHRQPATETAGRLPVGEGLYRSIPETNAEFGLSGVQLYQTAAEGRRWQLAADSAEMHVAESYSFLRKPSGEFLAVRTGNWIRASSAFGRTYHERERVELEGDVVLSSKTGYRFSLAKLLYDGKRHEFASEDPVDLRGPDAAKPQTVVKGTGFFGDADAERFRILRNVTANRRVEMKGKTQWMRISAQSGEFFAAEQRTVFQRNVRAELPDLVVEADRVEIRSKDDAEEMHAQGSVRLRSGDRRGTALNAYFQLDRGEIELVGDAVVKTPDGELQGSKIRLDSGDDRIEVEEAVGKQKRT